MKEEESDVSFMWSSNRAIVENETVNTETIYGEGSKRIRNAD